MLRRVKVRKIVENGEVSFEPDCPPPFTVIEYKERVVKTETDETGEAFEIKEPYAAIVETPHKVGEPSDWDEVENPIYFDIQIGDVVYSFRGTEGAIPVGLDEKGRICRIVYEEKPFFIALDEEGNRIVKKTRKVRKLIPPKGEALAIRNGKLGIIKRKEFIEDLKIIKKIKPEIEEFVEDLNEEFEDKVERVRRRLCDVVLRRSDFIKRLGGD